MLSLFKNVLNSSDIKPPNWLVRRVPIWFFPYTDFMSFMKSLAFALSMLKWTRSGWSDRQERINIFFCDRLSLKPPTESKDMISKGFFGGPRWPKNPKFFPLRVLFLMHTSHFLGVSLMTLPYIVFFSAIIWRYNLYKAVGSYIP